MIPQSGVPDGNNHLAEHIVKLYQHGKQGGVIILGKHLSQEWLQHVAMLLPSLLTSDIPVFMPKDYSNKVYLRLDSNIIFYEKVTEDQYILIDIFAVRGDKPICIEVGYWRPQYGMELVVRKNRWERRNDMMGAKFRNTLWPNGNLADFIYNENGTVIGSKG